MTPRPIAPRGVGLAPAMVPEAPVVVDRDGRLDVDWPARSDGRRWFAITDEAFRAIVDEVNRLRVALDVERVVVENLTDSADYVEQTVVDEVARCTVTGLPAGICPGDHL